mgnify:CR=1 FL=1
MFNKKKQPAIRSLIADGNHIEGNVQFTDGLRVDGSVVGNVCSSEEQSSILVISETASVTGEIHADHVIINGTVKGPVYARLMLELQPRARIDGDVHYTALEMHQGAIIAGQLRPMPTVIEEKPTLKLATNTAR